MDKIKFSDPAVFNQLEEEAIDGVLDYSEFPLSLSAVELLKHELGLKDRINKYRRIGH